MRMRFKALALISAVAALMGTGCAKVLAKSAFKDGNKAYKEENFKKAIEHYSRAVERDPTMAEGWFYLGSSHQAMYRPGKDAPDNKQHLDQAIENYKKSLEINAADRTGLKTVKQNTLGALTGIYSDEPYRSFDEALKYAQQLVQENPSDLKNLFAMANLYEKFEKVGEAEGMYQKAWETNTKDVKACGALAAFYNKPLWDGRSKFDQAIEILEKCAALDPSDPSGYYKVATFFWDKAYRDPLLNDSEKDQYADRGLEAVDKALALKPDYLDGLIYKGLLLRVKAQVATNPRLRQQYLEQAMTLQKQAVELKKEMAAAAPAAPAPAPQ